jgi:6-phosphogluconate dehydrogenase
MQLGMVGLGRMGANMTTRLLRAGHELVVFDLDSEAVASAEAAGATAATSFEDLAAKLAAPRAVWLMLPVAIVDRVLAELTPHLGVGDAVVDGGNSWYHDDLRRSHELASAGIDYLDVGVSGGVWGLARGYCLMVGGADQAAARLEPIFRSLAPVDGYLHTGGPGSGHYVKMIHNGIEYGLMQAYAAGFEIMPASDYELDLAALPDLWMQGSVLRSWLLELAADAFRKNGPDLDHIKGWVADSGEGRWTVQEAIDHDVPAPIITLSLLTRFRSRQDDSYGAKVLAALRNEFGGHEVKTE